MIAGGRVPAGEAGPMHVHQGDEVPRVLSGQILIRCRDRRRTARLVRRAPLPGNPNVPIWTAAASRQAGVMPAQIRRYTEMITRISLDLRLSVPSQACRP